MSRESVDRIHNVPGASNFRDFGNYPAGEGKRVVAGRLFRSAHLAGLDAEGLAKLDALGIATIIDLRGAEEVARAPTRLAAETPIEIVAVPIEPKLAAGDTASLPVQGRELSPIERAYRNFVAVAAPDFGRALVAVAAVADRPLVLHCTAGKDRTGLTVALIHRLLGVGEEDVIADFETTNRAWDRASASQALATVEDEAARRAMLAADPAYLAIAFEEIDRRHGSIEAFSLAATGDPDIARKLRDRLLEPETLVA